MVVNKSHVKFGDDTFCATMSTVVDDEDEPVLRLEGPDCGASWSLSDLILDIDGSR